MSFNIFSLLYFLLCFLKLSMTGVLAACYMWCVRFIDVYILILDGFPEGRYVFCKLPDFTPGYWIVLSTKCMLCGT